MPRTGRPNEIQAPPRRYSFLAALLSYLVPGLGQIYQGRVSKGLLFFICLHGMFFFGMYLGNLSNIYLVNEKVLPRIILLNYPRWQNGEPVMELHGVWASMGHRPQFAGQFWIGIAAWPALWQYYVDQGKDQPFFGNFERVPNDQAEAEMNKIQQNGNKLWDLAWVYTVIAGVLNVLVIYDAFAGPAFQMVDETGAAFARREAVPT